MKPRVLLAYPKINYEKDYAYFWSPFSLLTIAKSLEEQGLVDVTIFDGNLKRDEADWGKQLQESMVKGAPLFIGFSIMTGGGQIGHALEMARVAKKLPDCPPLVFGGPHVNVLVDQTAEHALVDIALTGPGQHSVPKLVDALLNSTPLDQVPGLRMRKAGVGVSGPDNPPRIQLLSKYPWHLVDVEAYVRDDPVISPRTLNYVSSQGCIYDCQFCYELTYQRRYSAIPAVDLLDDIEALRKLHNIKGVKFYDADWFIDLRRAAAFAQGLIGRGIEIKWGASINPNDVLRARRIEPNLLKTAADSGLTRLLMGVESGSNRVLKDVVHKHVTRDQVLDVTAEIASNNIVGSYTFIVGFPGESEAEQNETYALVDELRKLNPQPETRVHVFAPYPGTPLYEESLEYGFKPPENLEGWSHYDYYKSQTPWTTDATATKAREYTRMRVLAAEASRA